MADKKPPEQRILQAETARFESKVFPPSVTIKRGAASWAYIYTVLGFTLTIETGIVSIIEPLWWPYKLLALLVVGGVTTYLFLDNPRFHNKLLAAKQRYEDKHR